jgi:hypothetical protein
MSQQALTAAAGGGHSQQPQQPSSHQQGQLPGPAGKAYSYIVRIGNRYRAQVRQAGGRGEGRGCTGDEPTLRL